LSANVRIRKRAAEWRRDGSRWIASNGSRCLVDPWTSEPPRRGSNPRSSDQAKGTNRKEREGRSKTKEKQKRRKRERKERRKKKKKGVCRPRQPNLYATPFLARSRLSLDGGLGGSGGQGGPGRGPSWRGRTMPQRKVREELGGAKTGTAEPTSPHLVVCVWAGVGGMTAPGAQRELLELASQKNHGAHKKSPAF